MKNSIRNSRQFFILSFKYLFIYEGWKLSGKMRNRNKIFYSSEFLLTVRHVVLRLHSVVTGLEIVQITVKEKTPKRISIDI